MANRYGLRFAVMGLVATLCSMTFATTAPAYFDSGGATATTMCPFDNVIILSVADYHASAFDLLRSVKVDRVASDYPAFRQMAVKERASRSAVRPTALSGWRSGRVRTLAG